MRRALTLFAAFSTFARAAPAQDPDPVRKKLDAAREAYNRELLRYQTSAVDWFDRQEAAARAKGDKRQLDAVAAQRATHAAGGDLPPAAPSRSAPTSTVPARRWRPPTPTASRGT